MKLGVIARADDRGLAHQTWEVYRHLNPERTLVLTVPSSEKQGFQPDYARFPGATVMTVDDRTPTWRLNETRVREWLDGLDVVYTAETLYDDQLARWATSMGVATVIHCNPEWYRHHRGGIPHPTVWWSATEWRLNMLPDDTRVVPMPVPTDRWPTPNRSDERAVIHPAGRIAAGDRNGTDIVLEAAHLMPDVTVYLTAQDGLRKVTAPANVRVAGPAPNYWDTYTAPVMLLPRRYGGLCLPVIEACGAGVIPVLPDCKPNRMWPAVHVKAHKRPRAMKCQGGDLALYDCQPEDLAAAVTAVFDNIDAHRAQVAEWTAANSWDALAPMWRAELEDATERVGQRKVLCAPNVRPGAPVSVVVPFSEDRADVWAWVRARWVAEFPEWEIVEVEWPGEWCKASAVAQGVEWASAGVIVMADADSFVNADVLRASVAAVAEHRWSVPHSQVYRLTARSTERLLEDDPAGPVDHRNLSVEKNPYKATAGGGMVVFARDVWDECPMDPRFLGYGGEDFAWGEALETLVGAPHLAGGDLVHLWHPPLDGRHKSEYTMHLRKQYRNAHGVPRLMRALVEGRDPGDPEPLDTPARFVCPNLRYRVFVCGQYVQFRDGRYQTSDPDVAAALRAQSRIEEVT